MVLPDDGTLPAEKLGVLFDIIAEISKEYVYAFCYRELIINNAGNEQ
jgi:hypothetical protein